MRIDDKKIEELIRTSHERALSEGYTIATIGIKIEDLKLFEFEDGEKDYILADNMDNAIGFYVGMVGREQAKECEVTEIIDWHNMKMKYEDENENMKESTMLEVAKNDYTNWYSNPIYIASTCEY